MGTCLLGLLAGGCDTPIETVPEPGVTAMIGSKGGVLRSEDGVLSLSFGVGALAGEEEFRIVPTVDAPPSIGLAYHVEPMVDLAEPITVSFAFTPDEVAGRELDALHLARDGGGMWETLPTERLDHEAGTITARDDEISFNYGLIELRKPSTSEPNGADPAGGSDGGGPNNGNDGGNAGPSGNDGGN